MDEQGAVIRIDTPGGTVIAPTWDAIAELHAKLGAVAGDLGAVTKDGRNDFHNFNYTSYEQVAALLKPAFAKHALAFTLAAPCVVTREITTGKGNVATSQTLEIEACFTDITSGAMRFVIWTGEGADSQDKATAKALTSGVKYGLMRMFLFADREIDSDGDAPMATQQPTTQEAETAPQGEMPERLAKLKEHMRLSINPSYTREASEKQQGVIASCLDSLFPGNDGEIKTGLRHRLSEFLVGKASTKDMTSGEASALIDFAIIGKDDDGKTDWTPRQDAITWAGRVIEYLNAQGGQQPLVMGEDVEPDDEAPF